MSQWTGNLTKLSTDISGRVTNGLPLKFRNPTLFVARRKFSVNPGMWLRFLILTLTLSAFSPIAQAEIPKHQAIRAIIGEASDQGLIGMTAVAEALRNRGHLRGVYGLNAPHVDREPAWVWDLAEKAWEKSQHTNIVRGADHWESTDFDTPWWASGMILTFEIGKHRFYRVPDEAEITPNTGVSL